MFALIVVTVAAGFGCGQGRSDRFVGADIHLASNGRTTCTPAPSEQAGHDGVVREAGLSAAQATRLCILTSGVRQAQWIANHANDANENRVEWITGRDPNSRQAMTAAIAEEVGRALPTVAPPDRAPIVRTYLVGL